MKHKSSVPFIVAFVVALPACAPIPTVKEAGISYATSSSPWPAEVSCLNPPVMSGIAKEVLMGFSRTVVIAGGNAPISDDAWTRYRPSLGNTKNSDRHTLFSRSCFSRSPSVPADCQGDACRDIRQLDGHTWVALSKIDAYDCLPTLSDCKGMVAAPGALLVVVTEKCHQMQFEGDVVFLDGPSGERAVMHATNDGEPVVDVQLPAGWSLRRETLSAPLVLEPFGGEGQCFYNIIRDAKLQSYHQFRYAGAIWP